MLRFLIAVLLTCWLATPAFAQGAVCPASAQTPPDVELSFKEDQLALHEDVSSIALSQGRRDPDVQHALDAVVAQEHVTWSTMGLSAGQLWGSYEVDFDFARSGDNIICFTVSKIHYNITYSPIVYIASDLANKSCTYPVILTHEKSHVAVDEKTIADYLPTMKQQITLFANTIGQRGPYADDASVGAEKERLAALVKSATLPIWNQLTWLRRQRQLQIDTVANYKAQQDKCPGDWVVRTGK